MGEQDLIERARNGDRTAYGELMVLHHRTVEKFAFQCGVRLDDVPDVTQEVFIKLYRFLHQFQKDRFTTWLYKITLNTARDYYRKQSKEREKEQQVKSHHTHPDSNTPEKRVLLFEEDRELHGAVQQLEEKYRIPIVLFYFQDLTYEQISDILNVPLSTVKTRLFRAKGLLKKSLSAEGGAEHGRSPF
jgi:RNA polymerase sigma-70 factor (ECF subfamily)